MARKESTAGWTIEPLGKSHDRAAFSCGNAVLDNYLRKQAGQDARRHAAAPFVAIEAPGEKAVLGYYTLSSLGIELCAIPEELAARLPRYPLVPATLLGRLAVDRSRQGQGLGEYLLMDALYRAFAQTPQVASAAVVVDAIDDKAVRFYRHFEFMPLTGHRHRLFLPMHTIAALF